MILIDIDKWQEIYQALRKNKLRTFFTALGVAWGIFMLMLMMGGGSGLENAQLRNFSGTITNSAFIWPMRTTMPYEGFPRGRWFSFENADIQALKDNVPEIEILAPRVELGGHNAGNNVTRDQKNGNFSVSGDFPEFFQIQTKKLLKGRLINNLDIKEKRKVALIGERVYQILFDPNEDPIGKYINISGVYFKVIGVFSVYQMNFNAEEDLSSIAVPFSTFQQSFNFGDKLGYFAIGVKTDFKASDIEEKAKKVLAKRHHVNPDDKMAFGSWNLQDEYERFVGLFRGIRGMIWFVGVGTLVAGIIGVSNIMLIIIKERTKEIGIRRAIGAKPGQIINQILVESVFLTTVAGYIGLVFGIGIVEFVNNKMMSSGMNANQFYHPEVNLKVALISLLILILGGFLAGVIPARKAVSIKTVEALKDEI